ncbi:MAG: hypothetical protein IRZ33_11395, partial [Alicyclobacillaceae bacterium]|nr:hypothetical protein [Alicyclobacillaceae bacterium]
VLAGLAGAAALGQVAPDAGDDLCAPQPAQVVDQVVRFLAPRTSAPVEGPRYVPLRPDRFAWNHVSAKVRWTRSSYQVDLTYTDVPLPVNSPKIDRPPYTGEAQRLGGFGLTACASAADAVRITQRGYWYPGFAARAAPQAVSAHPARGPRWHRTPLALLPDVPAECLWTRSYPAAPEPDVTTLMWRQGNWRFFISGGPLRETLPFAQQLAVWVSEYQWAARRPTAFGYVQVILGGDGEHTFVGWAQGRLALNCWNNHKACQALRTAFSFTPSRVEFGG